MTSILKQIDIAEDDAEQIHFGNNERDAILECLRDVATKQTEQYQKLMEVDSNLQDIIQRINKLEEERAQQIEDAQDEQAFHSCIQHYENVYSGISIEVYKKLLERMKVQEEYNRFVCSVSQSEGCLALEEALKLSAIYNEEANSLLQRVSDSIYPPALLPNIEETGEEVRETEIRDDLSFITRLISA